MTLTGTERRRQLVTAGIGTVLTLVMGAVLFVGFRLASQMRTDIAALQAASTLQTYPDDITQQLTALRDRLEARAYSGQALADLQGTVRRFDRQLKDLSASGNVQSPQLARALQLWREYGPVLDPVVAFSGQPYLDSDTGSSFSREGRTHYAEVKRAELFATDNARALQGQLATLAATLQHNSSDAAARLRALLSVGVLAALVLAAAATYFQITRSRHERAAREAQEQTRDILKTVREGFFLLDANYRIGAVWSAALTHMFGREDFAGLSFEELLKDIVAPATLATATKYIKLLWGERAHENLMKSINPLGQLEISVSNAHGSKETRYLQFDFHRVMGPAGIKHVLCSVGDVTSSVLLGARAAGVAGQRPRTARHDARHDAPRSAAAGVVPRRRGDRAQAGQHHPQGTCAHRRRVPQEAHRPVPRAALDQGRGFGTQSHQHHEPRAHARGSGERLQEEAGALG